VRILKDFKSRVLEVRILNGLSVCFVEVRIIKGLRVGKGPENKLGMAGIPHPRVFSVRVANKRLKLEAASTTSTLARKEAAERWVKVESLELKGEKGNPPNDRSGLVGTRLSGDGWREKEKDRAEARRAQRFRREEGEAGRVPKWEEKAGWEPKFTVYVTASRDALSSYFLCSNDSNRVRLACKWMKGMGMDGN
jgi:hypothetical protein